MISEIAGGLIDIGFTVPGQAWTYWNRGPGPGDSYLESDAGKDWSHSTGRAAAGNLVAVARDGLQGFHGATILHPRRGCVARGSAHRRRESVSKGFERAAKH